MEKRKKRSGILHRVVLLLWVLAVNSAVHVLEIPFGWLMFLSNIMFFLVEGKDMKEKLLTVECGGLVGLTFAILMIKSMMALEPVLGDYLGFLLPLALFVGTLIMLRPTLPKIFNNVGFAYLTVSCIDPAALLSNIPRYYLTFLIGSLVFNGGAILLMKLTTDYLAKRT